MTSPKPPGHVAFVTCLERPKVTEDDALLFSALSDRDAMCHAVPWDDPGANWGAYDLILLRSCWDYHKRPHEFAAWLDSLQEQSAPVLNRIEIVRWNAHKSYLLKCQEAGIRIAPTLLFRAGENEPDASLFDELECDEVVLKPAVGASAWKMMRLSRATYSEQEEEISCLSREHDLLVQPFLSEIQAEGEYSLIFFDGEFAHSVLKTPCAGEFRVQEELGGDVKIVAADVLLQEFGRSALDVLLETPLYARVDLVCKEGEPVLMELELIEPHLFLFARCKSVVSFADAILRKLARPS